MCGRKEGGRGEGAYASWNHLQARHSQPLTENVYISLSKFQPFPFSTKARKEVKREIGRFSFGSAAQGYFLQGIFSDSRPHPTLAPADLRPLSVAGVQEASNTHLPSGTGNWHFNSQLQYNGTIMEACKAVKEHGGGVPRAGREELREGAMPKHTAGAQYTMSNGTVLT